MVTKAQKKSTTKYESRVYDKFCLRMPKGKREEYQYKAEELGYDSFNKFVIDAINEKIERKKNGEN